jgi:hypothetical protein
MKRYEVKAAGKTPEAMPGAWKSGDWKNVPEIRINEFLTVKEDSGHRPDVRAKLLYGPRTLHVLFQVHDQYVRAVQTEYQGMVCTDSCVELFVRPKTGAGYFNFEVNCSGCMLLYYISDATRGKGGKAFGEYVQVPLQLAAGVIRRPTLPATVDPEIATPVTWQMGLDIPFSLLEHYVGPLGDVKGQTWRANLFKCADQTSHPHWASWNPVTAFNFHLPDCFGELVFG